MLALAACRDSDPAPRDADTPTPDAARDSGADVGADTGTDTGVDVDASEPDGGAPRTELLLNADGSNERYAGIGRSNAGASCTAVLIDVGGGDDAPAYALASGHCTGWWDHAVAFEDRAVDAPGEVIFRFFTDTVEAHRRVPVAAAAYSSMMGTDLALFRLDATVGALRDEGIEGLAIADALPGPGASIVNVGAPLSTSADPDEHLRLGRCSLGERARLVEFEWLWHDNVVHDCPDIRVGSSGSPLLDASDAIVAIVHTTTSEPPHAQCHLGRPCELRPEGIASPDVTSYAIPVAGLGACFAEGVLDLARAGCPLVRSTGLGTDREGFRYVVPAPGATVRIALSSEVGITHAQAKWGPAVTTDCRSADGWNTPFAIDEVPVLEAPLPESDELFVVCLRAGTSSEIQPPQRAIAWLVAADGTPPALPLPVRHTVDGTSATFTVIVENPTYASYLEKSGPEASTDCDDPTGYQFVNVRFGRFTVTLSDEPTKICVVAEDFAGNRSEPMEWLLTGR
ncbi:MAG: serine protease [Myxococcota bacterium]|jgi:hypothetical protein|nr:serine protease [Myxococcota bacterium]